MPAAQITRLQIVLIRPHKGVALSRRFDRNVTVHGQFQLYADLLEVEKDTTTLVLAALKDGNVVKLHPENSQQHGKGKSFVVLSNVFPSVRDPARAEQLKITVDEHFVRRAMRQSDVSGKIDFEALDVEFQFCSVDEINALKLRSDERKELREQLALLRIDTPGKIVDFLQDYEREKAQKHEPKVVKGQKKKKDEKEEPGAGARVFYDLDGRKHVVPDKEEQARKRRDERKNSKWWVRLSKPRIRAKMDRKEQHGTEDDVDFGVEPTIESTSDEINQNAD